MSDKVFTFPKFWSQWAGIPKVLPFDSGQGPYVARYERFVKADCVIGWNDDAPEWSYASDPGDRRRVLVLKNNTNYKTVGQLIDVTSNQATFLKKVREEFPAEAKKLATEKVTQVVYLVRS
jgi:hypothetical protein